jgi:hypothetical protein
MSVPIQSVEKAVLEHFPGRKIIRIDDLGVWIRHNFRITLDENEIVYLKVDQAFLASEKEAFVCGLLADNNLPSPPVIALDTSGEIISAPYIIQKHVGGIKLEKLLEQESEKEKHAIFFALGDFYKKLHSIHHPYSGWIDGPGLVYTKSPNEHQFEEVIMKIGNQAVELGKLATKDHKRLQRIWIDNMGWLKDHQPSLGGVCLYWTVYLARENGQWYVTKLMDLEDLLYWDPAWDLTNIRYPAFCEELTPELWEAFQEGYGGATSEKRMKLYLLLQRLDAAMGNYYEPQTPANEQWKKQIWNTFPRLLDEVDGLQ